MKISTKLRISYLISAFLVTFAGVIIYISFMQINDTSNNLEVIDAIQHGIAELNIIGDEFLLYHEERPIIQWQTKHKSLGYQLEEIDLHDISNQSLLVEIEQDFNFIGTVFSDLVLSHTSSDILESKFLRQKQSRLQSHLLLKSQQMLSNATHLKSQISRELFSIQKYTNWISIILIMAAVFLSSLIHFFVGKSITAPIEDLIQGTKIIRAGNFEFRMKTDRSDEIGLLSRAFDKMIIDLKKITVSHDELESMIKKRTKELVVSNRQLNSEIEERKQTEKKLKTTELRYRTVADYTYDWEYWQNPDGSLQYVSPSCERICGYSVEDLMSNPSLLQDMIVPEDKTTWIEHKCRAQEKMESGEIQFRIQRPDGKIRWIEHACHPVIDHQGHNRGTRASNRDITKREYYRSETQNLRSELAHLDRVVTISTLTSALAHEINQPLAAMRSYAQAALRFMDRDQPEYDSVRKALQGIVADNKRAADVVNRMRTFVKKGPAHREMVDINALIKDVIGLVNSELVLKKTSITLDLIPKIPLVKSDPVQIQQVIINLLTNALDAMESQTIDKRMVLISTRLENSNRIIVSVSDSGEGIVRSNFEAIFSPFQTTKSTGMGLGLSICKTIIEAHGGSIHAENNPDGGALFSFSLTANDTEDL